MIDLLKRYLDKSAWINKELSMFSLSFSGLSEKKYFFFLGCQVSNKKELLSSGKTHFKKIYLLVLFGLTSMPKIHCWLLLHQRSPQSPKSGEMLNLKKVWVTGNILGICFPFRLLVGTKKNLVSIYIFPRHFVLLQF